MSFVLQSAVRNLLLSRLPPDSFAKLQSHLELVELPIRTPLVVAGGATSHVHFIECGIASVVATCSTRDNQIEVGHVGWEGMSGMHVLLDVDMVPNDTFMQVAGTGFRTPVSPLHEALDADVPMLKLLLRYVHTYEVQLAHSALAYGHFKLHERLARWLLMCHDRVEGDELALTHEFLSLMLGVRRSGVTTEVHVLEGMGAIKARRGIILVRDRGALERIADGCYGVPEREYERVLGTTVFA